MRRVLFTFLLSVSAFTLFSADLKIAVIDMEKVFQEYYKTKIADANIKKQAEVFKAYTEKLNESRTKLQEEFKELRDASQNIALSDSERESKRLEAQRKYRQVQEKEAEMTQYHREKQDQLKDEYEKNRASILGEIKKEIARRSALEGYTLVLDKSGKTFNNIPVVMHNSPAIDITDSVLEELNRGHKPKKDDKNKEIKGN